MGILLAGGSGGGGHRPPITTPDSVDQGGVVRDHSPALLADPAVPSTPSTPSARSKSLRGRGLLPALTRSHVPVRGAGLGRRELSISPQQVEVGYLDCCSPSGA